MTQCFMTRNSIFDTDVYARVDELIGSLQWTTRKQFANDRNCFSRTGSRVRDWKFGDKVSAPDMHGAFMKDYGHAGAEFVDDALTRFLTILGAVIRAAEDSDDCPVG